jgi:hypothetical protein
MVRDRAKTWGDMAVQRFLVALLFSVALSGTAAAQSTLYGMPIIGTPGPGSVPLPECQDPYVLSLIAEKFAYQDRRIIRSGLAISHVDGIVQQALRYGSPGFVDRRYCGATAWLSSGAASELVYVIEGPMLGPFSLRWGVQSCLPPFDPYRVYSADCRAIRP